MFLQKFLKKICTLLQGSCRSVWIFKIQCNDLCRTLQKKSCRSAQIRKDRKPGLLALSWAIQRVSLVVTTKIVSAAVKKVPGAMFACHFQMAIETNVYEFLSSITADCWYSSSYNFDLSAVQTIQYIPFDCCLSK